MATYAIGDIHGCYLTLQALLDRIGYDPAVDRLWLTGDLVNRGPGSLEVLRWARDQGDAVTAVLGNHDLHLIAVARGLVPPRPKDTLGPILDAPDRDDLLRWLLDRPLLHREGPWTLVHAGLLPQWDREQAAHLAAETAAALRDERGDSLLARLRGEPFPPWTVDLPAGERLRTALGAFTLLRTCGPDGRLCHRFSGPPAEAPDGCRPWFALRKEELEATAASDALLITGHWAALGLHRIPGLAALDSGCAWGGRLTALRLDDGHLEQEELLDLIGPRA